MAVLHFTRGFTVDDFRTIGQHRSAIRRDGQFFMEFATVEGARAVAELLGAAVALAELLPDKISEPGTDPRLVRSKVALAFAKALGGSIDFISFEEPTDVARAGAAMRLVEND